MNDRSPSGGSLFLSDGQNAFAVAEGNNGIDDGREKNETASVYTIPRSAVEGAKSAWWTDGAAAAGGEANDFLFLLFQAERASGGGLLFSLLFDLFLWRSASLSWKSELGRAGAGGCGDRPDRSRAEIAGISDRRSRSAVTLPSFHQIYESDATRGWILELEEQLDSDQARTK